MGSISYPWTSCKNLSTLIVSCALLIRVLSIGYVIVGIGILSKTPLIRCLSTLNDCKLGIFPLGAFFIWLILALTPAVIVNVTNSSITYLGICKRRNHYLQISTVISILNLIWFIILIGLWSWQINEVNVSECCGVERTPTPPGSTSSSTECHFCFDVFLNILHTYGRIYIAALILNCITEIIMIVGTSYLHGFYAILLKSPSVKTFDSKELHKLRNGAIVSMCLSLKENWKRNKLSSFFGYMSMFSLVIDGTIILAIFFSRIAYQDVTLTKGFNQISGPNNMNMGSIKDGLLVATVCEMVWSILAKALSLGGVRLKKRWLFVLYIVSEIITMLVECVILIFGCLLIRAMYCCFWRDSSECSEYTYPTTTVSTINVCDSWEYSALFLWTSTGILIFHIILKVVCIVTSDRVYKGFFSATTTQSNLAQIKNDSVGFFNDLLLKTKKYPVIAAVVGISIIICIVDCLFFCGLLGVRYGYTTGHSVHVADVLNGITLGSLRMSSHWDNAIIICLVSLSFSFALQLGKFVSITWQSPKWTLLILWSEVFLILLQFVSLSLVSLLLRLVYCCLFASNCVFSYDDLEENVRNFTILCTNEERIWERVMLQSWLMFVFGLMCIVLQIISVIFGYKYFKKSADGYLGIFKGVVELFRSMFYTVTHNRYINEKKMPNYNKTYGMYSIISVISLVLEMAFIVCLYAYYFTEGDSSFLLDGLGRFSHHLYNIESLYRAVSITILVIVPLATSLRISAFAWFWFRKSKISFYTILIFIPVWTLGEIVVLCYTSYILLLAYECNDSDFFSFSKPRPSRSTICTGFGSKLYVQSGLMAAYLVIHIILDFFLLNTMDAMHPYIIKYGDGKRFSVHLFNKAIAQLKQQTVMQRTFFIIHAISLVLNLTFWIGLILMGLIPGYIPNGFLDIISRIQISFGSTDLESAVLGVMYSLIAVVPLFEASHVVGLVGLFKQNKVILWIFIISVFAFCISDLVYLLFASEIAHFRTCVCKKGTNCIEYNLLTTEQNSTGYNLTLTKNEQNIVCGDLFLNSSSVLLAYILLTVIIHVVVEFLAIKILKGFGKTRVGIDDENINLHRGTNPQPSFKIEQNKVSNETTEENLSNQSITKNENIVPESEINVPSNMSAEENLNNQQHEVNSENKKKKKKRKKKKKKKIVTEEEL
nr:uncharacterized protein LOC105340078 isoform X3 [Crassostrea gigas]XP_034307961.1 uncharacterized protein LOC105340078 isoform X3 [Crassostrea gigas]